MRKLLILLACVLSLSTSGCLVFDLFVYLDSGKRVGLLAGDDDDDWYDDDYWDDDDDYSSSVPSTPPREEIYSSPAPGNSSDARPAPRR